MSFATSRRARNDPALPRTPLMFDPDTRWAYGGSLDRVSRLVEIASGETIDRYFRDHILGPLSMNDTGFTITENQRARRQAFMSARPTAHCSEAFGETDGAESIFRRRRHLFHGAGLSRPCFGRC